MSAGHSKRSDLTVEETGPHTLASLPPPRPHPHLCVETSQLQIYGQSQYLSPAYSFPHQPQAKSHGMELRAASWKDVKVRYVPLWWDFSLGPSLTT